MNIAGLAIKRPIFVLMIVLSIITLGIIGYSTLPIDLLPNVDFPTIFVTTAYPGASSEEIERLITKPLEDALSTVEGLDTLDSTSREGISTLLVQFTLGVDIQYAELKVREKVESALTLLPNGLVPPTIRRFSTEDLPIAYMSIQGNLNLPDLREILENDVQPRIESLNGVGDIGIYGARKKIAKISIDKALLEANGITYNQILNAVSARNISYPVGTVYGETKNITVRVYGKADTVNDIGDITLTSSSGKILRVREVAKVEMALEDETDRARVNKINSVLFAVYKQSGANTVRVVDNVKAGIGQIQNFIPGNVKLVMVSDNSVSIRRSVAGVQEDILMGAFLAIVIVWLFLGNFRSTIITAIALPNSLLGAFFLVKIAGFSINVMTLLSLSLAVGLLIDDSIVVRENIFRYIEKGEDPKTAAVKGTNEVALAVLSTTLSILAVFIPISFLSGVIGQFFRQFGLTVAFALMISLIDAFTTAPMLSAYWYKKEEKGKAKGIQRFFNRLSEGWNMVYQNINSFYHRILTWALNHKKTVLAGTITLFVFSFFIFQYVGKNFINESDMGNFSVFLQTYPGAPLDKTDIYVNSIEDFLSKQKDIANFYSITGIQGTHTASVTADLTELSKRKTTTQDMAALVRKYISEHFAKNVTFIVNVRNAFAGSGPLGGGSSSGNNTPILINIRGDDLNKLDNIAERVMEAVMATAGTSDVNTSYKPGSPELIVKLDNIKAQTLGFSAQSLGNTLRDLIQGNNFSTFSEEANQRDYDMYIRLGEGNLKTPEDVKNLVITTKTGLKVPLAAVATFSYAASPVQILRENKVRIVNVTANFLKGFSLGEVIGRIKQNIDKKIVFPSGYDYYFGGQQKQFADLVTQMGIALFLAILFMYMILASLYNSLIQPLYLMLSIPLAIIGSFIALLLMGIDIDTYGYIGLLLVMGLVAKNAILLIDFTNKQREQGKTIREALLIAGPIRLRPILMTSFAIIFGMLPLAFGWNEGSRGREALPIVVIGGILSSTFLTLVVVPAVYEWVETRLQRRAETKKKVNVRARAGAK